MADDDAVEGNRWLTFGLEETVLSGEEELVEKAIRELENFMNLHETIGSGAELPFVVVHEWMRFASEARKQTVVDVANERPCLLTLFVSRRVGADAILGSRIVNHALDLQVGQQSCEIEDLARMKSFKTKSAKGEIRPSELMRKSPS